MKTKPVELFPLDQLVQIGGHHLEDDAGVPPEHEAGLHVDDVPIPTQVLHQKMSKDFHFVLCFLFVLCLIPDHLDGNVLLLLVVKGFQHLAKGALSQEAKYLIPEGNMHILPGNVTVLVSVHEYLTGITCASSVLYNITCRQCGRG